MIYALHHNYDTYLSSNRCSLVATDVRRKRLYVSLNQLSLLSVRAMQTCMIAFTQLACCPSSQYSSAQVQTLLAAESEALKRLAALDYSLQNIGQLRTSAAEAAASTGSYAQAGSSNSAQQGRSSTSRSSIRDDGRTASAERPKPVKASYGQLMGMRAKELKRLLQEHGVDSSDCFEKEELVNRVLERCTLAA